MKKFEFTLDKLLRYKDQVLDSEKNRLKQLQQVKNELEDKLQQMYEDMLYTDLKMKEEQKKGVTVSKLKLYEYRIENARHQISQLKLEKKRAEIEVEKQIQVVVAASQEVTSLDKLMEKQYEEYLKEQARADETMISEFVSSKLVRSKSL